MRGVVRSDSVADYYKDGRYLRRWELLNGRPACIFDAFEVGKIPPLVREHQLKRNAEVRELSRIVEDFEDRILMECDKWLSPDLVQSIRDFGFDGCLVKQPLLGIVKDATEEALELYRDRRAGDHDLITSESYFYDLVDDQQFLTHFTRDITVVQSILENGLLYIPQTRKLLGSLFPKIADQHEFRCRGMVCFFEGTYEEAAAQSYGQYGIALKKQWAEKKGAAKVLYMDQKGPVFSTYLTLLHRLMPTFSTEIRDRLFNAIILGDAVSLAQFGADDAFISAVALYDFVQHIEDYAEREWRIMAPSGGISIEADNMPTNVIATTRLQFIKDRGVPDSSKPYFRLKIPPEAVHYLIAPESETEKLSLFVSETSFSEIPIRPFPI